MGRDDIFQGNRRCGSLRDGVQTTDPVTMSAETTAILGTTRSICAKVLLRYSRGNRDASSRMGSGASGALMRSRCGTWLACVQGRTYTEDIGVWSRDIPEEGVFGGVSEGGRRKMMDISRLPGISCATSWRTHVNTKAALCELNKLDNLIEVEVAAEGLCVEVYVSVARLCAPISSWAYLLD